MKAYIINAKYGTFTPEGKNEEISYSNAQLIFTDHPETSPKKNGCFPCKVNLTIDQVHQLGQLPAEFECEFLPGQNTMTLASAERLKG